jgi:hypothetical protein
MKRLSLLLLTTILATLTLQAQQTLWGHNKSRFGEHQKIDMTPYDSIVFKTSFMFMYYKPEAAKSTPYYQRSYGTNYDYYTFQDPGRIIWKPQEHSTMNFDDANSQWCFQRSRESEHFIVFWEKGFGEDPMKSDIKLDVDLMLQRAEMLFTYYTDTLGFVVPGQSKSTDKYKIEIFVKYQTEWLATGSGYDDKIGALWCNPWALQAAGGHTLAHEIGHSFQYLVSCDLGKTHGWRYGFDSGASEWSGNMWWEACAQWQGFKVYPEQQFSNDNSWQYLDKCNKNLLHEDWRYANFFIQDYWCMLHGKQFIGRLWRESVKPEDPVEAYQRLTGITQEEFNDEMFRYAQRVCSWDIDGIRERGSQHIDNHSAWLHDDGTGTGTWVVDQDHCVENYGYNIIRVNTVEAGTTVKAHFKGLAGADGYRRVNIAQAGWRYGFCALKNDGSRVYGVPYSAAEGVAEFTVPDDARMVWFVVSGAPKKHWRHEWDDNAANDEQWPYQVRFENTDKYGEFGEYAADYVRRDTTVTISAELPYDGSSYSSISVKYDVEAASKALGLSTAQLRKTACNGSANPGFFALNATNSNMTVTTTTTTSSATVLGHWFDAAGNVCSYNNSACIFAEFTPADFACKIGQYPGHLKRGQTYTVRQGIRYKPQGSARFYRCTYIIKIKVV